MTKKAIIIFTVTVFWPGFLFARQVHITSWEMENITIRAADSLHQKTGNLRFSLESGFGRLYGLFGKPALSKRPVLWLTSEPHEFKAILEDKKLKLKPAVIKKAIKAGLYRDLEHIIMKVDPRTPNDWVLRLVYTELTRNLMDAVTPSARGLRIGWFYAGMSVYMAWMVQAEQDKQSVTVFQNYILNYYGRYFDPKRAIPLELLEVPEDWQQALRSNPNFVYSQAVLAYLHLAQLKGPNVGVLILRIFEKEDAFQTAFERATDLTLKKFESDLKLKLYARIKAKSIKKK